MIAILLKAAVLWLSILGYCCYIRKKGVNMAFAPVITLAAIGSAMFMAGILNMLPQAVGIIVAGGIVCGVAAKPWSTKAGLQKYDAVCLLVFSLVTGLFALRIHDQLPTHYDAFSHWLTVVREVLKTDSFPNFQSELILFQGYPTGSAGMAYFVCKFVGTQGDDVVLFAQALPMAASLCVFLAFVKRFDLSSLLVMVMGGIFCLVANSGPETPICEPLPDTLISVLSIAALAIVVYYRAAPEKGAWASLPVQIFLVAVKNSGLFMMVFNTALLLFYEVTSQRPNAFRRAVRLGAIHSGIPAAVFFLWSRHVAYVFPNGTTSKHTVSLENYRNILAGKTVEDCLEIVINFAKRFLSQTESWVLLGLTALVLLLGYLVKRRMLGEKSRTEWLVFAGILTAYLTFMAGLVLMYLLSMPYSEAVGLAGYNRYEKTILIYLVGGLVIYVLQLLPLLPKNSGGKAAKAAAVLLVAAFLFTQGEKTGKLFIPTNAYEGSQRQLLEEAKADYGIPDGASCLIYGPQVVNDSGYHYYLGRYVFWTKSITVCAPGEIMNYGGLSGGYQYLIVMEADASINAVLQEAGYTPGQTVYKLQ